MRYDDSSEKTKGFTAITVIVGQLPVPILNVFI